MVFDDHESRKEFLSLQSKIDQIMDVVATNQPQNTDFTTPQSLVERVEWLETKERMNEERMIIGVEMGIRELDNNKTVDQKEFISTVERLIMEVTTLKDEFKLTLEKQATHSKQ